MAAKLALLVGVVGAAVVDVNTTTLLFRTSAHYNSWNIDASANRGFFKRDLSAPGLLQLARGLPGGYLRFGGSGNDALWYGDGIGGMCAGAAPRQFNCLNATTLDALLALAEAASARLVFGLNLDNAGGGRHWDGQGAWNSTNAEVLVRYLAARGQPYAFELGNEDNGHYPAGGLSPAQEARGFAQLAALVAKAYPAPARRPKIIGPDADYQDPNATQAAVYKGWAVDFLGNASALRVPLHAATLHEYIDVGFNGTAWTSLDPDVLDRTGACADDFRNTVRDTCAAVGMPQPEVWAGEIGPHNGGSPPCDRSSMRWANFANSFWYVDALASKAAHGFSAFCRQDFIGADYGLLDCATQTPLPDYHVSRAWTQLMGAGVLAARVAAGPRTIRAYAHCAADGAADVVVLLLNLDVESVDVEVVIGGAGGGGGGGGGSRTEWHFTAGAGGLGGTGIRLGGVDLVWSEGQPLPPLPGASAPSASSVHMAPQSIAFVRVPAGAPAGLCR